MDTAVETDKAEDTEAQSHHSVSNSSIFQQRNILCPMLYLAMQKHWHNLSLRGSFQASSSKTWHYWPFYLLYRVSGAVVPRSCRLKVYVMQENAVKISNRPKVTLGTTLIKRVTTRTRKLSQIHTAHSTTGFTFIGFILERIQTKHSC